MNYPLFGSHFPQLELTAFPSCDLRLGSCFSFVFLFAADCARGSIARDAPRALVDVELARVERRETQNDPATVPQSLVMPLMEGACRSQRARVGP